MAEQSTLISNQFGSEIVPVRDNPLPNPEAVGLQGNIPQEFDRVPFNDATAANKGLGLAGRYAREAEFYKPESGLLEGVGAAITQLDTSRLIKRIFRPTFDDEVQFDAAASLQDVNIALTEDERDYYLEVARGAKSAAYALEQIEQRRTASKVIGDNPLSMLVSVLDPIWYAIPPAVKVARLAKSPAAARAASGAITGVAGAGVAAGGEGPLSDGEILLAGLLNGAVGTVAYRGGRMVKADAQFPDTQLAKVVDEVKPALVKSKADPDRLAGATTAEQLEVRIAWRNGATPTEMPGGHKMRSYLEEVASGDVASDPIAKAARTLLDRTEPGMWDAPVRLSGNARPYASYDGFVVLRKDSEPRTIVHEAVHIATMRALEQVRSGDVSKLGPQTRAGVERLNKLWQESRTAWEAENGKKVRKDPKGDSVEYGVKDVHEFAAQAMTSEDFQKWLASRPGIEGGQSVWRDFLAVVAKVLGIKATGTALDEAIDAIDMILTARDTKYIDGAGTAVQYAPRSAEEAAKIVDAKLDKELPARRVASAIMWNMHKTMSSFGEVGKKVADLFYDNNLDLSKTSLESHREAILSELRAYQYKYEDIMRTAMKEQGFGILKMLNPRTAREALKVQNKLERQVQVEMFRREAAAKAGVKYVPNTDEVPKHVLDMANALDELHRRALAELKAAGVSGAEALEELPGYMTRKWSSQAIDDMLRKLEQTGMSEKEARKRVNGLVGSAVLRANNIDPVLANKIGAAIVDRALRKGYFEDAAVTNISGEGQLKQMRDMLKQNGVAPQEIERILDALRVQTDDTNKAGFLKHRMDIDYKAAIRVGDESFSVVDLIDNRVSTIVDNYVMQASTTAAFARKGFKKRSDIDKLREDLLHSLSDAQERERAKDLFDNTIAYFRGDPNGAKLNENFRLMQAYGRTITLAWSGLWQLTEYANVMAEYGLRKALAYGAKEIPGLRTLVGSPTKEEAGSLVNILAEHSSQSMRIRPYLSKFEDGFELDTRNALQLSAQTAGQLVPYANAMKFVHHAQAKVVANLVLDRLDMAAKGNAKARAALAEYGIDAPVLDRVSEQIRKHGLQVDSWDDAVWAEARPAFAKMMDAAVLRQRLGDMPAFAVFDNVGKMLFTYRTFILAAHNKILAGTAARRGGGALGLVLLYQFPLAMAAVQAQAVMRGEGPLKEDDLVKRALGQMGGLGLFSEPLKWITGESNSVGAPVLIPADRFVKTVQATASMDPRAMAGSALAMAPVIQAVPVINSWTRQLKED